MLVEAGLRVSIYLHYPLDARGPEVGFVSYCHSNGRETPSEIGGPMDLFVGLHARADQKATYMITMASSNNSCTGTLTSGEA